jgi:hypothetical protein
MFRSHQRETRNFRGTKGHCRLRVVQREGAGWRPRFVSRPVRFAFFLDHPRGTFAIEYPQGLQAGTSMETLPAVNAPSEGIHVATLRFVAQAQDGRAGRCCREGSHVMSTKKDNARLAAARRSG